MWNDAKDFPIRLQEAAERSDALKAQSICEELIQRMDKEKEPFPEKEATFSLIQLQRKRMFPQLQRLAEEFVRRGQNSPQIRRRLAQALLEQDDVSSAITVLDELERDTTSQPDQEDENAEARGLQGRAFKQLYVNPKLILPHAVERYYSVYSGDSDNLWHGINAIALLSRAKRDKVALEGYPDPRAMAQQILDRINERVIERSADMWDLSTAAEACVALHRPEEAIQWIERYVQDSRADAFELGSTRRQFTEVWQLDDSSGIGAYVLPLLNARLLACMGGKVKIAASRLPDTAESSAARVTLERVLGSALFVSIAWWDKGRERCKSVARVEGELDTDRGLGSGFLVRGRDLKDSYGDGLLLLTNAHVISNDPKVDAALRPDEAYLSFKALGQDSGLKRYRPKKLVQTSPPNELDFSLLELEEPVDGADPFPIDAALPLPDGTARVYVIGYPYGGGLSFSINDNELLDRDDRVLHYRAPTEGGSSGSPVFNQKWNLIGLHHGGGLEVPKLNNKPGTYAANEGIWIQAIRKALEQ
jgi:S1-C subfamily serine protease